MGMTTCFANNPSVTALNLVSRLPRCVRGPVERLEFLRFASSLLGVTDLGHRMGFGIRLLLGRVCGRLTATDSACLSGTVTVDRPGWIVKNAQTLAGLHICAAA